MNLLANGVAAAALKATSVQLMNLMARRILPDLQAVLQIENSPFGWLDRRQCLQLKQLATVSNRIQGV